MQVTTLLMPDYAQSVNCLVPDWTPPTDLTPGLLAPS
jgi:hypothetical protein